MKISSLRTVKTFKKKKEGGQDSTILNNYLFLSVTHNGQESLCKKFKMFLIKQKGFKLFAPLLK